MPDFSLIDFRYAATKFVRDAVMFFVGSEAVLSLKDTEIPDASLESLGIALAGAVGTAAYRIVRDLFFTGETTEE